MELGTFIAVLWRRKLLALIAILLAVGAGAGYAMRTGPSYTYSSTVLLLPPDSARKQAEGHTDYTAGNPLFYLGSLDQARDILVSSMSSNDAQDSLLERFPGATYSVAPDVLSSSPVVVISATAEVKSAAFELTRVATEEVPSVLTAIQAKMSIDAGSQITSDVLTTDKKPTVSHKGQIRRAIMAAGGVGLVLLFLIGALDGWLRGRRRKEPKTAHPGIGLVREEEGEVAIAPKVGKRRNAEHRIADDDAVVGVEIRAKRT